MASTSTNPALGANTLFNVGGLVALITGGGTGIGLMLTKALIENGAAKVYIAGRRKDVLEAAAHSVSPNVIPVVCDVTSKASLKEAVSFIENDAGFLNLLVCNSGIGGPQVKGPQEDTTLEAWAGQNLDVDFNDYVNTFAVNTASVWFTTMAVLPLLDRGNKKGNLQQASQVIVTSSVAAFNRKAPGGWAYGQSKAAATLAVKQLAVALPQWNIRANCIAPGLFPSEMSEPIVKLYSNDKGEVGSMDFIPLKRMGDEQDMAGTFLYLASRAGAYCNGTIILLDGGRLGTFPSTNY